MGHALRSHTPVEHPEGMSQASPCLAMADDGRCRCTLTSLAALPNVCLPARFPHPDLHDTQVRPVVYPVALAGTGRVDEMPPYKTHEGVAHGRWQAHGESINQAGCFPHPKAPTHMRKRGAWRPWRTSRHRAAHALPVEACTQYCCKSLVKAFLPVSTHRVHASRHTSSNRGLGVVRPIQSTCSVAVANGILLCLCTL